MISDKKKEQKPVEFPDDIYQSIINDIRDTIVEIDLKGKFTYVSPQSYHMFGYKPQEVVGKSGFQFIHPEDVLSVMNLMKTVIKDQKHVSYEYRAKHKNGGYVYVSAKGGTINREGKINLIAVIRDISENKIAEAKLKDSERQYRTIIESMGDPIHVVNEDLRIILRNNALNDWLKDFNINMNIIGGKIADTFPFLPENVINDYHKVFETGKTLVTEECIKLNENEIYTEVRKIPIINEGKVIQVLTVVKNITDKKIAEIKLKKSEKEYRNIIENTKDAIVIVDFEGKLLYVSPQLSQMLKGREISKNSRFFRFIHKEDVNKLISFYKTVLNEKTFLEKPVEFRILPKNGDYIWFSSSSKNYYDDNGNVIGFISTLKDITDKKLAEQKLKESEQKYRLITEVSNDLIRVLNDKFEVEYVNESSLKNLLGYTRQEILGRNSIFLNHPDDYTKVRRFMLKLFKNGENIHNTSVQHKNGSWMWYENKAKMFTDEKGNQKYLYISRDVTERIKTEKALKESEQKYRLITENSNDLIRVLSEDFKIEFLNEKAHQQVLGYTRDDLIGDYDTKLFTPEDYPKLRRFMLELFKHKEEIHVSRMRHKKGYYLWFEVKTKMFKDEQGKTKYLFISRDITERRQTEIALMESEEKYRNLYKNSPNAVVLTDKNGVILDVNSSAEKILGYGKSELKGRNYIEFNMANPNQITAIKKMFKQVLKGVKPKHIELQIKKKNGNMIWILFQSSMVKLNNEIIVECIAQDITDKKKAENLIIEENKRLLELNKMKTELISRVSHELKTPITSIFGGTQILLEVYKDQTCSEALEFIELINRGGKRLKVLIENLLDASRIESEKLRLNLQKENIVNVIKNCVSDNRYIANKRNMIVELNMPEIVSIEIDKMRIEQVITNLLSNAIKNTPKKGIIKITLEEKSADVYFKIEDNGIGLTKKEMETLFLKFGKIERYGQKMDVDIEGSGLGLYISKEIIDMHGGHIWVESAGRNMGSTFYFKLFNNMNGTTS